MPSSSGAIWFEAMFREKIREFPCAFKGILGLAEERCHAKVRRILPTLCGWPARFPYRIFYHLSGH